MFHFYISVIFIPFVIGGTMEDFFPNIKGNLTKITWAHAVNSKHLLVEALNSSVMMIEADIIFGKLNGQGDIIPIMGHPPATSSDISLETFLNSVYYFNKDKNEKKGIKLDFKSTEVFEKSIEIIYNLYDKIDYPIWMNADILPGPLNAQTKPVDPNIFLNKSKSFRKSILSIGWTTNYSKDIVNEAHYSDEQINQMLDLIKKYNLSQEITFPVRAGIIIESNTLMIEKLMLIPNTTLTIWSSHDDPVSVSKLRNLILHFGIDRVYIDLPKDLRDRLNLSNNSLKTSYTIFFLIAFISVMFFNNM